EQRADAHAPGGLAGDGDTLRIPTEGSDVVAHPAERGDLVADAVDAGAGVLGAADLFEMREAQRPETVVDADRDDIAARGEGGAVVPRNRALAGAKAAAMDPDEHRPPGVVDRRRAHVER